MHILSIKKFILKIVVIKEDSSSGVTSSTIVPGMSYSFVPKCSEYPPVTIFMMIFLNDLVLENPSTGLYKNIPFNWLR